MYNIDINNIINDIELSIGETKRMDCPNCNGYKTFTITNNMGSLMWNCYKASCSVKGKSRLRLSADDIRDTIQKKEKENIKKFMLPEYVVPLKESNFSQRYYGVRSRDVLYDVKENRVVFPIWHKDKIVDATGKSEKRLPKWKRYGNSNVPYSKGEGNIAVVVEDCISAYVVSFYECVGVALLGTSLSDGHREFLLNYEKVIIALAPDASKKTLAIAKELRGYIKDVKVLKLTDDLKYRKDIDIENLKQLKGV